MSAYGTQTNKQELVISSVVFCFTIRKAFDMQAGNIPSYHDKISFLDLSWSKNNGMN